MNKFIKPFIILSFLFAAQFSFLAECGAVVESDSARVRLVPVRKALGLVARHTIPEGSIVARYPVDIIRYKTGKEDRVSNYRTKIGTLLSELYYRKAKWGTSVVTAFPLDADHGRERRDPTLLGHLINDVSQLDPESTDDEILEYFDRCRDQANVRFADRVESLESQAIYFIEITAVKEIKADEPILYCYGPAYWDAPQKWNELAYQWLSKEDRRPYWWHDFNPQYQQPVPRKKREIEELEILAGKHVKKPKGTPSFDSTKVHIDTIPGMGRGLRASHELRANRKTEVARYPIDYIDSGRKHPRIKAISNYGMKHSQEIEEIASKVEVFKDHDSEFMLNILYRYETLLDRKFEVFGFPLHPKDGRESDNPSLLGHLLNDASPLGEELNRSIFADVQKKSNFNKIVKAIRDYLDRASETINCYTDSELICEDGECYVRIFVGRKIEKNAQLHFFYGPDYWFSRLAAKYTLSRETMTEIRRIYRDVASEWLVEYVSNHEVEPFWWVQGL